MTARLWSISLSLLLLPILSAQLLRGADPAPADAKAVEWVDRALEKAPAVADESDRRVLLIEISMSYAALGRAEKARQLLRGILPAKLESYWRAKTEAAVAERLVDSDPDAALRTLAAIDSEEVRGEACVEVCEAFLAKDDLDHAWKAARAAGAYCRSEALGFHIGKYYVDHGNFKSAREVADQITSDSSEKCCRILIALGEILAGGKDLRVEIAGAALDVDEVSVALGHFVSRECAAGQLDRAEEVAHVIRESLRTTALCCIAEERWKRGDKAGCQKDLVEASTLVPKADPLLDGESRHEVWETRAACGDADAVLEEFRKYRQTLPPFAYAPDTELAEILIRAGRIPEAVLAMGRPARSDDLDIMSNFVARLTKQGHIAEIEHWLPELPPQQQAWVCVGVAKGLEKKSH